MTAQLDEEISRKKIKFILSILGHKYFKDKTILDIGAGGGEIGAAFFKLGAKVTAIDSDQDKLKLINRKYPAVKIVRRDLDSELIGRKYNIIFHLDTLQYLKNYQYNLIDCLGSCDTLILEANTLDLEGSADNSREIEEILTKSGMHWIEINNSDIYLKNIWIASRDSNLINGLNIGAGVERFLGENNMSTLFYQELAKKKVKFILSLFSHKYFINKNVLDAGAGNGDIGAALFRLGASVTAADARQENLTAINKKYPGIKVVKSDFESPSNINSKFDIGVSIGTLCHVSNYEQHLKDLCVRCKDLILETAVCDSDDPEVSFQLSENSAINNLSASGNASRPSAARIEKILSENGMNYVKLDVPELNYEKYVYDWKVLGTNNRDIFLRRFWICSKNAHVINEIAKKTKGSVGAPTKEIEEDKKINKTLEKEINKIDEKPLFYFKLKDAGIRHSSQYNSLIESEKFSPSITFNLNFSIAPSNFSSKQWIKKIHPFFPNLLIHKSAISYKHLNRNDSADLSVGSIDNIIPAKNIFLEEWSGGIDSFAMNQLQRCERIITPSIHNYAQLSQQFSNIKIIRSPKFWFSLDVTPFNELKRYALYFEKNEKFTPAVVESFKYLKLDNLIVVGSRLDLPKNIVRYSEYEDYEQIVRLMFGASAIIDVSENQNYDSAIINFAKAHNIFTITNNYFYIKNDENSLFIRNQIENGQTIPDNNSISFAFSKFENCKKPQLLINKSYNQNLYSKMINLLGK